MDKIWVVTAELDYFHDDEVETEVQSVGYFTDKQAAIDAVMAYEQNPEYFTEDEIARRPFKITEENNNYVFIEFFETEEFYGASYHIDIADLNHLYL